MRPHSRVRQLFAPRLGVDLGTSRTRVCVPGQGIVFDEPSLVAVRRDVRGPGDYAVGNLASLIAGRTAETIRVARPIRAGVVADFDMCEAMLAFGLRQARRRCWGKPSVLVPVPSRITSVERQAIFSTTARAGTRQACLINKAQAAALGAGLPIADPVACMICDIGGGTTEIAVLCQGTVAVSQSLRVAGEEMDQAIADHVRSTYGLSVGEQMAERIKVEIGTAAAVESAAVLEIGGQDMVSGLPRKLTITGQEVREALADPLRAILRGIRRVLENCPPELSADLMETGLILAGGAARLSGFDRTIAQSMGIPVRVAEDPASCVVRGLAVCLENLDIWQHLIQDRKAA